MTNRHPSRLDVKGLTISYGRLTVLQGVDLETRPGEFISLLGPSGSGKTTLLMAIAGFVIPDTGSITKDGVTLNQVPPHRRKMGVVFQSYALFPHMSVRRNIAFSMRVRGRSRADTARRTDELLALVRLEAYADRMPGQLSGGQQQRVAIARALASDPAVLLMDEPLSALDKKLREEMLVEIRRIHDATGVTTIYVTHDQREALTISDRVAVMKGGRIEQLGTPEQIYNAPRTRFVADFIGEAAFLPLVEEGQRLVMPDGTMLPARGDIAPGEHFAVVRPEHLDFAGDGIIPPDRIILSGVLRTLYFQGETIAGSVEYEGHALPFRCLNRRTAAGRLPAVGERVRLLLDPADIALVPKEA